jgi:hypothetical protein
LIRELEMLGSKMFAADLVGGEELGHGDAGAWSRRIEE